MVYADGNFTVRISETERNNEMEQVASTVNFMYQQHSHAHTCTSNTYTMIVTLSVLIAVMTYFYEDMIGGCCNEIELGFKK